MNYLRFYKTRIGWSVSCMTWKCPNNLGMESNCKTCFIYDPSKLNGADEDGRIFVVSDVKVLKNAVFLKDEEWITTS